MEAKGDVNYQILFLGYKKESDAVVELKRVQANKANYVFQKDDLFVRATVISDEPLDFVTDSNQTKKAWIQPQFINN